jgi:hypothetical protein
MNPGNGRVADREEKLEVGKNTLIKLRRYEGGSSEAEDRCCGFQQPRTAAVIPRRCLRAAAQKL